MTLEPIDPSDAYEIWAGTCARTLGEGYPHADSRDGLLLVAKGRAEAWFVVCDDAIIGEIGTHGLPLDGLVEIGYGLAAPFRGRGYGSEIVPAIVAALARRDDVTCIIANVKADNEPSRRVLARAGLVVVSEAEGILRYERRRKSPTA